MTPDILFDNFIITNDKYVADKFATDRWVFIFPTRNCITVEVVNKHLVPSMELLSQIDHCKRLLSVNCSSGLLQQVPNVSWFYFLQWNYLLRAKKFDSKQAVSSFLTVPWSSLSTKKKKKLSIFGNVLITTLNTCNKK